MSTNAKGGVNPISGAPATPDSNASYKGMKIFTYPKIIFMIPTLVASLICGIGMTVIGDRTHDPTKGSGGAVAAVNADLPPSTPAATPSQKIRRFSSSQNVLGVLFVATFALNLLVMAIDFPRFTVLLAILGVAAFGFFFLWLNVYYDLVPALVNALESVFVVANAGFYLAIATVITMIMGVVWVTRYLDYWEILPNEILHNHGPFSDLERYPTINLKFDKEIPDILEYALLRSGRLVLHVEGHKPIVMDNVLWIDQKEARLKKLMSRLEVRVTSDQEASEPM